MIEITVFYIEGARFSVSDLEANLTDLALALGYDQPVFNVSVVPKGPDMFAVEWATNLFDLSGEATFIEETWDPFALLRTVMHLILAEEFNRAIPFTN